MRTYQPLSNPYEHLDKVVTECDVVRLAFDSGFSAIRVVTDVASFLICMYERSEKTSSTYSAFVCPSKQGRLSQSQAV